VSYYAKGALVALVLDLKLRLDTEGRISLDDVMQECWSRWGQSGEGMPEDGIEQVSADVSGLDLGDFFDATVRGTGELPLQTLLESFGVNYYLRPASNRKDKGGKPADKPPAPSLGATLSAKGHKSVFTVIQNGSPAELAGIAPGDVAVALDGLALTAANCDRRLRTYRDGDELDLHVLRGDELISTSVRIANGPKDTCYLQIDTNADAMTIARQAAWLNAG
jgi:predicted metalloprotease with PDZ domain